MLVRQVVFSGVASHSALLPLFIGPLTPSLVLFPATGPRTRIREASPWLLLGIRGKAGVSRGTDFTLYDIFGVFLFDDQLNKCLQIPRLITLVRRNARASQGL